MRRVFRRVARLTCAIIISTSWCTAIAASWFETETRKCEFESPLSPPLPLERKTSTNGNGQYFVVPKLTLNELLSTPNGAVRVSRPLSQGDVSALRTSVNALKTGPQVASVAIALVGEIADFSGVYGVAAGGLLSWLNSVAGASTANAERFADFVTSGGETGHVMAFRSAAVGFKPLLLLMTTYEIQVGAEKSKRKWLLSTCLLPIEVILSEVTTTDPGPNANPKVISRQADGSFRMWDVTDSKFDSGMLLYLEQDEVYSYFARTPLNDKYRIHMYGGGIQRESGINWGTLYKSTTSK